MTLADYGVIASIALGILNILLLPALKKAWAKIAAAELAASQAAGEVAKTNLSIAETNRLAAEAKEIALQALRDLNQFKLQASDKYISGQTFDRFQERLFDELKEIKAMVNMKVDKP